MIADPPLGSRPITVMSPASQFLPNVSLLARAHWHRSGIVSVDHIMNAAQVRFNLGSGFSKAVASFAVVRRALVHLRPAQASDLAVFRCSSPGATPCLI